MMKGGGGCSTSTSTSGRIEEEEAKETTASTMSSSSWGTWEELLLACAVKRHGVGDWDSVAMEVQAKTSLPHLMTNAHSCKLKYQDLQRRFSNQNQNQNDDVDAAAAVPWLDDLKKLRLAQLRHDLRRYDNSIMSLQLKVKRLEEERQEQGGGEEAQDFKKNDHELKPDLEEHGLRRSENDKPNHHHQSEPDRSKQPLDHENQSVNGSNSTCSKSQDHNKHGLLTTEPKPLPTGSIEPDSESAETVRRQGESSEAQSSASLTRRSERKRRRTIDDLRDQPPPVNQQLVLGKSQPLVEILQMIRAHQHSSFFERRLPSQESDKYKRMVQQHLDLETIQTKLNKDSYSSTSTLTFYRDLLLLFTNAVVFFPKSSTESVTGHKLRRLVLNEMKKNNLITRPAPSSSGPSDSLPPQDKRTDYHELERSDSLLAKHKSTAPIIVCRKRSSISSKPSTLVRKVATTTTTDQEEKKPALELKPANDKDNASNSKLVGEEHLKRNAAAATVAAAKTKEKIVTGTRSSRRTSLHEKNGSASKKKSSSPGETPKSDKKKKTPEALDKKRSGAAADFLKRMKRNSPAEKRKVKSGTSTPPKDAQQKKRGGGKVVDKVAKERVSRQSGGENNKRVKEESSLSKRGRPTTKATEAAAVKVVSRKRSRDSGGKQQQDSRLPKKRSRR